MFLFPCPFVNLTPAISLRIVRSNTTYVPVTNVCVNYCLYWFVAEQVNCYRHIIFNLWRRGRILILSTQRGLCTLTHTISIFRRSDWQQSAASQFSDDLPEQRARLLPNWNYFRTVICRFIGSASAVVSGSCKPDFVRILCFKRWLRKRKTILLGIFYISELVSSVKKEHG